MICKLLTVHHLEFLSLKRGCTGMFESTHIKIVGNLMHWLFLQCMSATQPEYDGTREDIQLNKITMEARVTVQTSRVEKSD